MFQAPNFTKIPNEFFALIPTLSEAPLRVLLVIMRQTFGWGNKEWDRISLTQFQGRTGMSRQGVINGLNYLIENGCIFKKQIDGNNYYCLNVNNANSFDPFPSPEKESHKDHNDVNPAIHQKDQGSKDSLPTAVNPIDQMGSQVTRHIKETTLTKDTTTKERSGGGENPHEKINRQTFEELKRDCPNSTKKLYIFHKAKLACDYSVGIELSLLMPPEDFERLIMKAYNLEYEIA